MKGKNHVERLKEAEERLGKASKEMKSGGRSRGHGRKDLLPGLASEGSKE